MMVIVYYLLLAVFSGGLRNELVSLVSVLLLESMLPGGDVVLSVGSEILFGLLGLLVGLNSLLAFHLLHKIINARD